VGEDASALPDATSFACITTRPSAAPHVFRGFPPLEPTFGVAKQGLATSEDSRWLRQFWEVLLDDRGEGNTWVPFAKGGEFSRFYFDHALVINWADNGRNLKNYIVTKDGSETKRIYSQDWYFRRGLSWPRRTAKGLNVRRLPRGCIFVDKGPALFLSDPQRENYLLGLTNTHIFEYLFQSKTSFSWEVGIMKVMPIPQPTLEEVSHIGSLATCIHDCKASWDEGNEISTRFIKPWLIREDIMERSSSISDRLECLTEVEAAEDACIQKLYAELNDEGYRLYGLPDNSRQIIEETLGERPPEIIWP
jgi:hypothetical protein